MMPQGADAGPESSGGGPVEESGQTYPPGQSRVQDESNYTDGSGPLFSMYTERTGEEDRKMTENWKADADGILVFTGLFSAAVASLAAVSVQGLQPSSQDASAFYLANIYQLLADANGSHVSIPPTLSNPFPFSPPSHAVWVNSLWFLSLAMSLTCALLATLLQQWARRFIRTTQSRHSPHTQARIRAFFAEGVERLHLPLAVEALPTLLHISLFVFFVGLLIFLFNINHTVFSVVAWWIGLCIAGYACITLMPMFRHDSPYYAPPSSSAWFIVTSTLFVLFRIFQWLTVFRWLNGAITARFERLKDQYHQWFSQGMEKTTEKSALNLPSDIDCRALMWTFDRLEEDHELERFFRGIPGLFSSRVIKDLGDAFIKPNEKKLLRALIGFMDRTSSSNLVKKAAKQDRAIVCVKAMDAASFPINREIFDHLLSQEWGALLDSVEFGLFMRKKVYPDDPLASHYSQMAVSMVIARAREYDVRWFELASGQLNVSRSVLRNYLAHGDSVLLANLVHTMRHIFETYQGQDAWHRRADSRSETLESASHLNVQDTLPELQHGFCALWNEITAMAQNRRASRMQQVGVNILRNVRNVYITLHQGPDAAPTAFSASTDVSDPILGQPSSYPLCNIATHRPVPPDSTSAL
ncbi:hypothetical protein BJV78DRAFT_207892 [Lactifluus subvellereus]|nr:hypothetical protein BJV78DRAFT_207892 [Lactifluus subvellereus]